MSSGISQARDDHARGKLDIYLIIILAVMIVLARLISHQ